MKLLVDMNLSPSWVERLRRHGFEAVHLVHYRRCDGARLRNPDVWANDHGFVLVTNDLDFSSILAASAEATPSVVQIRTQDLLCDAVVNAVADALKVHREQIERGALLSIEESATRVRVWPLR